MEETSISHSRTGQPRPKVAGFASATWWPRYFHSLTLSRLSIRTHRQALSPYSQANNQPRSRRTGCSPVNSTAFNYFGFRLWTWPRWSSG